MPGKFAVQELQLLKSLLHLHGNSTWHYLVADAFSNARDSAEEGFSVYVVQ
jgi:hypothetical protein